RNALGFYTYDISNPPTSKSQITKHTVIFPNVSYQGSGGAMISGQKVKIGTFSKNTGIGWFLVANGWNGSTVGNGNYIQYSDPSFNLEVNPAKRAHMVLLNAASRNRVLIGFEDMSREGGSDNDFNDALFYVTANPYSAIQSTNVVALPSTQADSDNDGVYNAYDAYPTDPTRAYDVYFPSKSVFGTLCFEDLWPGMGDFDFNDLVVGYNFQEVMNGQNDVVEIKSKFLIRAIGASFRNGFGIEFPISSDQIANVTGQRIKGGVVSLGANNVEVNCTKASVIMWDNPESLIRRTGGAYFNTEMSKPKGTSDTVKVAITFSSPQSTSNLGAVPFNPFIFVNQIRDKEVHLPDYAPTAMAGSHYFGTSDDNSIPSSNRFYKTSKTLPFALNIPAAFDYPTEKSQITASHLKFRSWAQSSGLSFTDWYKNNSGYRNTANVYNK
ncbi:MAG: LruC domain-containing protein, partial [Cytophagales bacterium]|nr:LruC domain-containing protein [Cytophagales bacterium]